MLAKLSLRAAFSKTRIFSHIFVLQNSQWVLEAALMPPTMQMGDSQIVKSVQGSNMLFSIIHANQRFKKGSKPIYYSLRNQQIQRLACWDPEDEPFEWMLINKMLLIETKDKQSKSLNFKFYDKGLQEAQRTKQFVCPYSKFSLFQKTLLNGFEQFGLSRYHKLSNIGSAIREIKEKRGA